jgi:aldose sugar dehydrogenase
VRAVPYDAGMIKTSCVRFCQRLWGVLPCVAIALGLFPGHSAQAQRGAGTAELWENHCAKCHGAKGEGGGAGTKSLLTGEWRELLDGQLAQERQFFDKVKNGIPDSGMEAFGETLSDAQIWGLVVHIRELQGRAQRAASGSPSADKAGVYRSQHHMYRIEDVVEDDVTTPWAVDWLPSGEMLMTERGGNVRVWHEGKLSAPIEGIPKSLEAGQGGMMDVATHPEIEKNGWVYLSYSDPSSDSRRSPTMTRVVRGKVVKEGKTWRWTDNQLIWEAKKEHYVPTGLHFGSRIVFQKAGSDAADRYYVFWSIGDRGENPGTGEKQVAQDLTRPSGKIHRLWDDGSVPEDNPFVSVEGAYASIYSYGHRNPQGLVFDLGGTLWDTEHGPRGGDELNLITKGHNYGWPVVCFGINYSGAPFRQPFPDLVDRLVTPARSKVETVVATAESPLTMPVALWTPSIGACGLDVLRSGAAFPQWKGDLFAGGLSGANVDRIRIKDDAVVEREEIVHGLGRVRDVVAGPEGHLYVVLNGPDKIIRLVPAP